MNFHVACGGGVRFNFGCSVRGWSFVNIMRDFKNAPFYILCLFHMINLRMLSLSFFILLQNEPGFAIISICSCCSF